MRRYINDLFVHCRFTILMHRVSSATVNPPRLPPPPRPSSLRSSPGTSFIAREPRLNKRDVPLSSLRLPRLPLCPPLPPPPPSPSLCPSISLLLSLSISFLQQARIEFLMNSESPFFSLTVDARALVFTVSHDLRGERSGER